MLEDERKEYLKNLYNEVLRPKVAEAISNRPSIEETIRALIIKDYDTLSAEEIKELVAIITKDYHIEDKVLTFWNELEMLINKYSKETGSNTPDFILMEYIKDSLWAFDKSVIARDKWYNHSSIAEHIQSLSGSDIPLGIFEPGVKIIGVIARRYEHVQEVRKNYLHLYRDDIDCDDVDNELRFHHINTLSDIEGMDFHRVYVYSDVADYDFIRRLLQVKGIAISDANALIKNNKIYQQEKRND